MSKQVLFASVLILSHPALLPPNIRAHFPTCGNLSPFLFQEHYFYSVLPVVQSLSYVWLFWDAMDCSPPGSFVHEISQARILEWVAISFPKRSSQPRGWTHISCIGRQILYHSATREAHSSCSLSPNSASTENDFCVPKGRFKANLQGATGWIPGWVKGGVGVGFGVLGICEN